MSSVTAVPLQPIKKGSILFYWSAIIVLILAAFGLAYWGTSTARDEYGGATTTASGLRYKVVRGGEGKSPTDNDVVLVNYTGRLANGQIFDQNPQGAMPVNDVVPGFSEGLKLMQRGGKYRLWIPAKLGYGANPPADPRTGQPILPANSDLVFDVELLEFKSRAEVEAMQKQMEELQKKQGAQGGMPGGAPHGLPPGVIPGQ